MMAWIASIALPQARTKQQHHPPQLARLLAKSLAQANQTQRKVSAKAAHTWASTIQKKLPYLQLVKAMIIVEREGEDLGFGIPLRETRFAFHTQKKRQGKELKKDDEREKALFDLTQGLDKEYKTNPSVSKVEQVKQTKEWLAVAPIVTDKGAFLGNALVQISIRPTKTRRSAPFWMTQLVSWLIVSLLIGGLFFIVRGPWGHIIALLGLVGVALYPYVDAVEREQHLRLMKRKQEQKQLQSVLKATTSASPQWTQKVFPAWSKAFSITFSKSQVKVQLTKNATQAQPSKIDPWGSVGIGLLGVLLYLFYAFGFLEAMLRTLQLHRAAYLYTAPAILGMLVLVFAPFTVGIALSFFQHEGGGQYTFVGLKHFHDLIASDLHPFPSPLSFYFTLTVTILWTLLNVALHVSIGLGLALLLKNPMLHMKEVYRVLLILPWAIPNYITALIWKGMFHQQFGAVNALFASVGIAKVQWFSQFSTAFTANLVTNTWLGFPFMMVVSLGALQSIPGDLYEAAEVDGANGWQKFWYITMPLLKPALFPAIILGSIWTFNMFNVIYLVSGGGPEGSTDILITEAYHWAFTRGNHYGYAAAYSVIIFIILLGYSLATNKITKATEGIFSD